MLVLRNEIKNFNLSISFSTVFGPPILDLAPYVSILDLDASIWDSQVLKSKDLKFGR